jgi:cGMP-dependent protein kinase
VLVLKDATEVRQMGPKDIFGEQAFYVSSLRMASVVALTEVECLALSRDNLSKILGDKVQQIIFNNQIKWRYLIAFH